MKLRIRMLGPMELRAEQRHRALGSSKEGLTLAALAWDVGKAVPAATLVGRIWDDPSEKALGSLYTYLSRLRRTLHEVGGEDAPVLPGRARTYQLDAPPDTVDMRRYTLLIDGARTLHGTGRSRDALARLEEAAALWRGEPLAGAPGLWAEQVRRTLSDRHLEAAVLRAEIAVREGRYSEAVAELAPLEPGHPVHEPLIEQLALALYAGGRAEEAASLMRRALRLMMNEHGIDPGGRLRRVHEGILRRTPVGELLPAPPVEAYEPRTGVPDSLPLDVGWVGRQEELRLLTEGADRTDQRPVGSALVRTVDGLGAVGKTALAVHAAHLVREHFPGGAAFLDLRAHAPVEPLEPAAALTELLRAFGVSPSELPQSTEGLAALWRTTMANRRAIVVLDDASGADQVRPLLPGSSPSLILITSRRRLTGLPHARSLSLQQMSLAEGVALFYERTGSPHTGDDADAAEIVRLCDRIPLAVVLAAGRLQSHPSWSAADLRRLLADGPARLPELRDGPRELGHSFALSYEGLTPHHQLVFRRLGLHFGSDFGIGAAAALAGLPVEATERAIEELCAHHLVNEPWPNRFRTHDLVREFAVQLAGAEPVGDRRQAVQRLLDFYLRAADRADREAYPHRMRMPVHAESPDAPDPGPLWPDGQAHTWLATEGPNLLAALTYTRQQGSPHQLAYFTHALSGFMDAEGYLTLAEPLLKSAVAHWTASGDDKATAYAQLDLNAILVHSGNYQDAISVCSSASDLARDAGNEELVAEILHQLSISQFRTGMLHEALHHGEEALDIRLQSSTELHQARGYRVVGTVLLHLGRHDESLRSFNKALSLYRREGNPSGQLKILNNISEVYTKVGRWTDADRVYQEAISLSRVVANRSFSATLRMNLANVRLSLGKALEAFEFYSESIRVFQGTGDRLNESICLNGMGSALQKLGRAEEAVPYHEGAIAVATQIRAATEGVQALRQLGAAELTLGRLRQADGHLRASLALAQDMQAPGEAAETLMVLAEVQSDIGHPCEAQALREQARSLVGRPGG